jgi:hypothetical protein
MLRQPDVSSDVTFLRRAVARAGAFGMTIRGRILVAFLVMSVITASLGGYAAFGIRDAGVLVDKTFDESLMSINYARAAATDFAAMRAAFARQWIANDPAMRSSSFEATASGPTIRRASAQVTSADRTSARIVPKMFS